MEQNITYKNTLAAFFDLIFFRETLIKTPV